MPPPTMMTSWCESGMTLHHTATFCSCFTSALRVHDQGCGGRRLMTQRARSAGHGDLISAGLCSLQLAPLLPPLLPPPPQDESNSASRNNPSSEAAGETCFLFCFPIPNSTNPGSASHKA
jgi:hypothetical protein